jgi:hypothetical protein
MLIQPKMANEAAKEASNESQTGNQPIFHYWGGMTPPNNLKRVHRPFSTTIEKGKSETTSTITKDKSAMRHCECPGFENDDAYSKEWRKRSNRWLINISSGGKTKEDQEQLCQLGLDLSNIRLEQGRSLKDVADSIGISSALLCFLETGWGTKSEFRKAMDTWTTALGVDTQQFKGRIPVSKRSKS